MTPRYCTSLEEDYFLSICPVWIRFLVNRRITVLFGLAFCLCISSPLFRVAFGFSLKVLANLPRRTIVRASAYPRLQKPFAISFLSRSSTSMSHSRGDRTHTCRIPPSLPLRLVLSSCFVDWILSIYRLPEELVSRLAFLQCPQKCLGFLTIFFSHRSVKRSRSSCAKIENCHCYGQNQFKFAICCQEPLIGSKCLCYLKFPLAPSLQDNKQEICLKMAFC